MANIDLIRQLNKQYGKKKSPIVAVESTAINEAIDPDRIQKALSDTLAAMGPNYTGYFDWGLPTDVALLFIDVCNFSTRFSDFNGEETAEFFDQYYDIVIPIIYKYGGEIDKIIGDGIICVFGLPFLDGTIQELIANAQLCAKEIIKATIGTIYSSKVALHAGTINYFKNKTGLYKEFTLIGKPLTELFRLESVSVEERINYFGDTIVRNYFDEAIILVTPGMRTPGNWYHHDHEGITLKGVTYHRFHSISLNR